MQSMDITICNTRSIRAVVKPPAFLEDGLWDYRDLVEQGCSNSRGTR
jgi:hypothetical protein